MGRLDDTVVIVTSDHGENLGEHHLLSHVLSMHETLLRVPLAMAGPYVDAGVEESPVGLTSLVSTIRSLTDGRWDDPASRRDPTAKFVNSPKVLVTLNRSVVEIW